MSDDKMTAVSSTFVVASSEGCLTGVKSRPYKIYIIIAVSGIVALTIILTAILLGVRLSSGSAMHLSTTETPKDIVQFSYNMDADTKQEVTSDMNMNLVQYHVMDKEYEMWIVNNFNRDIQVMKIQTEMGTECFMTPLNRTIAMEPSKISSPSGKNMTNTTYIMNYISASIPVSDSASMCETGRSTCKGMSTYWLFPSCDDDSNGDARRQKRRSWRKFRKFRKHAFKVTTFAVDAAGLGLEVTQLVMATSAGAE